MITMTPPRDTLVALCSTGMVHDVVERVVQHLCATTVQRRWRIWSLFGHARRRDWDDLRTHLIQIQAWPHLVQFEIVRREWRVEPSSWFWTRTEDVAVIREEATKHTGLWGRRSEIFSSRLG